MPGKSRRAVELEATRSTGISANAGTQGHLERADVVWYFGASTQTVSVADIGTDWRGRTLSSSIKEGTYGTVSSTFRRLHRPSGGQPKRVLSMTSTLIAPLVDG